MTRRNTGNGMPPAGFEAFVAARSSELLRLAWLLTGDADHAEDLLQIALAEVWPKWSRISAGSNPAAYVRMVMVSRFRSSRRRRWWNEIVTGWLPDSTATGDQSAETAARDMVRKALDRLSPQQRAVIVLRYLEDLSIEDTAAALSCSPATVKVQSGRALAKLRNDPELTDQEALLRWAR